MSGVKQEEGVDGGRNTDNDDEVLGDAVSIQFDDGVFYGGAVRAVKKTLEDDGTVSVEHYVVFDDGDELWFDISSEGRVG